MDFKLLHAVTKNLIIFIKTHELFIISDTDNSNQQKNSNIPITAQLLQNSGLFNQNNSKSSDDIQKKFNEILLPMIMMSNSLTSSQLATLLPI